MVISAQGQKFFGSFFQKRTFFCLLVRWVNVNPGWYESDGQRLLPADHVGRVRLILAALDAADRPEDLDIRSLRLHRLRGDKAGYWAVTVRANWRIVFVSRQAGRWISIWWIIIEGIGTWV